jgi:hypothetical protein
MSKNADKLLEEINILYRKSREEEFEIEKQIRECSEELFSKDITHRRYNIVKLDIDSLEIKFTKKVGYNEGIARVRDILIEWMYK